VPHGAKTYLAAALAFTTAGERLVWIARDAEIGDRVAEELVAWSGDPAAVAVLEPRTSLAYERGELIADETAARVAALATWRSGRGRVLVASVQSLIQHTIDPADLPDEPRELRRGMRLHQETLLRELFALGYVPVLEVAGRGESARRGGIVDVFPPSMALPIRIEFFGDEIDSLRSFDPTDQRTIGEIDRAVLLPATEFLLPHDGAGAIRERLGRAAAKLPERLAADLDRFETGSLSELAAGSSPGGGPATRALTVGDAAEVWAAHLAPATGLDHIPADTLLVIDEPATSPRRPSSCGARPTSGAPSSSAPASCPRTGRPPISRHATGRTGSSGRGPSSSPGSRCRPRTWRWLAARCRRGIRSAGASRYFPPAGPAGSQRPSTAGPSTAPGSCSRRTRRHGSPTSSPRPATRSPSSIASPRRRLRGRSRSSIEA
jgi:hypothetical protein